MYNKKSKVSAVLTLVSAALVVGCMILMPFLLYNTQLEGIATPFVLLLSLIFGFEPLYASAIPYAIVALTFGSKMLKQQSRKQLISLNTRMLITTCVLLPFLAWGMIMSRDLIVNSSLGFFPIVYTAVTALAYIAALIAQLVTTVSLKKSPAEETDTSFPPDTNVQTPNV